MVFLRVLEGIGHPGRHRGCAGNASCRSRFSNPLTNLYDRSFSLLYLVGCALLLVCTAHEPKYHKRPRVEVSCFDGFSPHGLPSASLHPHDYLTPGRNFWSPVYCCISAFSRVWARGLDLDSPPGITTFHHPAIFLMFLFPRGQIVRIPEPPFAAVGRREEGGP